MNKERDEKLLKSWLKKKITITTGTVVAFLITGLIISTPIYASVLIGATENDNLTVTKTNNQGSKVDNSGITIGGAISKAGSNSVHIGDYSGSMGSRNVVIGTNASAGYDAKKPNDNPPKDDAFNQSVAIGAGGAAGEGARAYGDQSIAIGSNTIAIGNSSIAIGNDDVDKTGSTNTTYTDLNGQTKTGSIANAYNELTGQDLGVLQYQDTTSKEAAVAIGVKSVAGDISLALGTGARAEKVNAVAIGTGATANRDNAIAIGGGSTTDKAATQELSTTVNGLTFKWSGGDRTLAGDVVSFGKAGYERQLKHVSPGKVSEDSTDAINGSQLHGVLSHLTEDPVFMFAADDSDKSNVVGDTPAKKQEDGKTKKIVARSISDSRLNILGGAEGELSDKNISVRYEDEKTLKIKLAKNLTELESAEFKNTGGDKTTINGDGVTITPVANGKKPVSVTKDGLNNGGNVIANVAGNLEGAKPNSTEPTTNATVPTDVDSIKNNAATVGDVLNAGWNLQNNEKAKDFVKPYDTVNFADGNGTTAVVDTEADRSTSKIKYNVNLGNGLGKDAATNKITVKTADESLTVDADGLKAKTDGKTITTGDSGLKVVTGGIEAGTTPGTVKVTDGDNDKIATVDSVVKAVNNAAFTLKASADGGTLNANSTVPTKGELIKAGKTIEMIAGKNLEVTHNKNGKITFATVENPSFETVQLGNSEGPKFSATADGNIKVSDKDDTKPVKITNVADGTISDSSKDAINGSQFHKLANNTIKLAGQNESNAATETDAQTLNQQNGIKFTVKSSDGKLLEVTAGGDTITLTPKTGTITTTNGVPTATTTNGKLVTADQLVSALTEMGWKATADKDGTGTVTGTTSELIKAGNTVTFKAGDNLAIKQDGKNFIYSLNTALSGLTSAEFKDGNKNKVNITPTGITITKPADTVNNQPEKTVTLNQNGLNNGGNLITNVASNLDGAKTGTIEPTTKATAPTNVGGIKNNAATVGDVLNAGWNLQGNNKDVDFVKPYDTVNFINGDGTTATVETTDNKVSTVKYSVNLGDGLKKDDTGNTISIKPADKSLEVNKDGLKVKTDDTTITTDDNKGLKVVTGAIESVTTGNDSGTVKVKEGDTGKIATVDSVVNAVNSAAFTLKASATTGGTRNGSSSVGENGEDIKAGKTIEMIAGKNLNVTHNENGKIIFATVDTPTFSTVQVGGDQGPKFSKTSDGDIKVSDKDDANPVKITNVKDGAVTDTSTDAINGSQFHKVANNTIKLAGQNGDDATTATQTKEQNLNKQGGIKFTVKSSDGKLLEVKAADDTITLTPKTATITIGTDGVPTANTNGGKLVTADDLVTALKNMGWKATAGQEGSGTVAGNAEQLIKAGETVTFKAGNNLIIKQSGKEFAYSLNPELTDLSKVEVKDKAGNSVVTTPTGTTITAKDATDPTKDITTVINAGGTTVTDKDGNTTKVDGNGITITPKNDPANPANDKNPVKLTKDGLNNGGNAITNVAGNLPKTHSDTKDLDGTTVVTPTPSQAKPDNIKNIVNNAATVGDVLNAGWNLQNNGTAKDFVKPYDTVNFVDGLNTKAIVTTDADGKVSNVQIDVKDLPIAYTNESGDKVVKAADGKYYKESDLAGKVFDPTTNTFKNTDGTAATQPTEVAKDAIKTNLVNPKAEGNKAGDPTELGNVKSGLDTIKDATGGTTPSTTAKTAGLVNLDEKDPATNKLKVSDNNVATVGDLRNMGWVVSSDKTTDGTGEYSAQVKNANEVRFVGKGTATVSGKTDANGVRTITVEVNDQVSTNNSVTPVVYTKADGTKVYHVKKDDGTIEYHTTPDGKGAGDTVVPKNEVITSVNGPEGTKIPTTLSNVAGNLDGAKTGTTAPTTNAALPNTTDKTGNNYINPNNAATVGDVLNAGWNLQNNGTAKDFVKPYDTVNFINGGNTTAVVTTDKDGTTSNVTYNVTGLPITYTNEAGKPVSKVGDNYYVVNEKGQPLQNDGTPVTKYDANGNPLNDDGTPVTKVDTATKPLSTNLVNPNATTDKQTTEPTTLKNVKGNLPQVNDKDKTVFDPKTGTTKPADDKNTTKAPITAADAADIVKNAGNNAATVGDVLNAGWNLQGNGDAKDFVKPYDTVNFIDGGNTKAVVTTAEDGKSSTVTYNVTGLPITYTDKDGNPVAKVGDKFYPVDANGNPVITKDASGNPTNAVDPSTLKTNMVNPTAKPNEIGKPTKLSNVAPAEISKTSTDAVNGSQLNNTKDNNPFEYADKDGNPVVKANDGKFYDPKAINSDGKPKETQVVGNDTYLKEDLDENGTPKAGATPLKVKDPLTTDKVDVHSKETKPITNVVSGLDNFKDKTGVEKPLNDLRDLNKVGADGKPVVKDNTAATVGDLRNLGWIVSSDKTTGSLGDAYADSVKHANEVKFVGKNGIQVSGKTDNKGVRTLTFEMEAGEVTPTEIAKADGTKLVKVGDKAYKPEDIGTDGQPKQGTNPVGTIAKDGNVYATDSVIDSNGNVYPAGTTLTDGVAPAGTAKATPIATNKPNNGAKFVTGNQVADAIEKSGFVVGKNNKALSAADFKNEDEKVNPNDELRFADGDNTNVKLATKEVLDASGKVKTVTTVKVDVVDLPVKYTDADGNIVKKGEDGKYYNPKDLDGKVYDPATKTYKNADGSALAEQPTPKAKDSIVSSLVNPNDAKDGKVGTPSTLTNVANGAKTFDPAKDADGNDLKLGNDGKWYPADSVLIDNKYYPAGSVKNADGTITQAGNTTPVTEVKPVATPVNPGKAGLVNFSKSNPTNAATVGDLRNMGWVVGTPDNKYNDQVRNANKVDFKGGNGIEVTGKTTADGTRQITIGLDTGKVTNEVTITKPNGEKVNAIKVTQPDGTVKYYEKDKDGKADLKKEVPVGTGANDNKVTADDGSRVVTGNAVATAIGESGWNVGKANTKDVTKAFETEAKLHDKVNPNDDVKFVDGDNTTVSMVTIDSQNDDGTKKATTYIKTDINKDIHIDSVTAGGKNADGTPGKDGALTVKDKNGNDRVKVDPNGMTITPNKADGTPDPDKAVSLTNNGLNNGGNNITNVKSNLPQVNDGAKKAYDVNGNPIANKNNIAAPITAADAADIVKKAGNNAATVSDVLNAGWNLQENGSDRDFVKPYDTVNFVDGTNTKVTVKTNEDGTKSNVQINLVGLPIAFADKDGNRVVQGVKDGKIVYHKMLSDGTASKELVDPKNVQVTNVNPTDAKINTVGTPGATINNVAPAEISPTSTQAVNGSQLYQVAQEINNVNNKVDKLGERVNKGLAGAAAMSGIEFMEIGINQATVAAAVGGYRGTHAVAVGVQAAPTENTRVNAKMSLTPGSRTEAMYSVGAAYRFNLK